MNTEDVPAGSSGRRKIQLGCFSQLLIALGLCVALVVLAILIWTIAASSRLEAVLSGMRAAGYSTTPAELETAYGPPPDPNAGSLWIEAGAALLEDNGPDTKTLPFIGTEWDGSTPTPADIKTCKAYLARHGKELASIRRAASIPDAPRYRDQLIETAGNSVDRGYVTGHRQILRVLRIVALVQANEQDLDRLCGTLQEQLRVGKSLSNEPTIMGQLVAVACGQMAIEDIQKYVRDQDFNDEQLARLQLALRENDPFKQMRRGMEGEFVFALGAIDAATKPIPRNEDKRFLAEQVFNLLEGAKPRDWAKIHQAADLVQQQCNSLTKRPTQLARFALSANSMQAYAALIVAEARIQTLLSVTDSLIAAKRYKMKHGMLPTDWDQIVPNFMPTIPVDPNSMNGESLVFKAGDERLAIYGLGKNRHDDGGSSVGDKDGRPLDIVAELP